MDLGESVTTVDGFGCGVALFHQFAVGGDDAVTQRPVQFVGVDGEERRHRRQRRRIRQTRLLALRLELGIAL